MDELIREEFRKRHCNKDGVQQGPLKVTNVYEQMYKSYPKHRKALKIPLRSFIKERSYTYCDSFPRDEQGIFLDSESAFAHLKAMRPDLDNGGAIRLWDDIRARHATAAVTAALAAKSKQKVVKAPKKGGSPERSQPITPSSALSSQIQQPLAIDQARPAKPVQVVDPVPPTHISQAYGLPRAPPTPDLSDSETPAINDDILAKKLSQLQLLTEYKGARNQASALETAQRTKPDFSVNSKLLKSRKADTAGSAPPSAVEQSIRQAPLLTASIVAEHYKDLVPQYGLLGNLEETEELTIPQLFLNTNVPFSAFICGVQGSGKSHTTSCILENAILASSHLGHLESPVSTLVFSYGEWSSGGVGFNISEATFLGASHPEFPDHHVKKVTVLYSPSNPAIRTMYERLPNVKMVPFRLKARTLDISALHTLMAVDDKSTIPLYMATVEAILRDIASKSADGSLDYLEFKRRLAKEKFDSTQTTMLSMRMNLLESFLDLNGTEPVHKYKPGEVTIIDLSDAFLTPSTACILFKLGLEQFLQSNAPGKMVVLDEAHKYMLDTQGSKVLTDYLTKVIRLQRHLGARVIISTQEPTIATELIALCSITVMHRFTSPTWYAALRKHINAVEDDREIMQRIEALDTGEALVYSPNAVLGKYENGSLIKAIGTLMKVSVRNRVTLDGGASIMAV